MNHQPPTLASSVSLKSGGQSRWLRGIVPPMITPLRDRDALDVAGLERLVEHIVAGGVQGLFILGTSGEAPSLSYRLRRELIERICRQVNHRVPVLVGTTDTALVEAHQIARHAADCGVSAVVSAPPYYFAASQEELVTFVKNSLKVCHCRCSSFTALTNRSLFTDPNLMPTAFYYLSPQ